MNVKRLFADDDAVSPVIGVILMVAITVILAAVIGTFVLGLGDQVSDSAPQASFTFDYSNTSGAPGDTLVVTHDGGDKIAASQVNASVTDAHVNDANDATGAANTGWEDATFDADFFSGGDVTAGTSDTLNLADFVTGADNDAVETANDHLDLSASTVRITWSGDGGSSATLGKWTGPSA